MFFKLDRSTLINLLTQVYCSLKLDDEVQIYHYCLNIALKQSEKGMYASEILVLYFLFSVTTEGSKNDASKIEFYLILHS